MFPLSGDYYRIQQNGAACKILKKGMSDWGDNFTRLSVSSVLAFEGRANLAFAGQLNVYNVVMKAVGGAVSAGSGVFDSIAKVSEKIAIRVEKALIQMGKKLLKLAKVVGKRFLGGWASAALLIKDLAQHGLSVITDVVDDVKWCIAAIDKCFEMKDEIEAWAKTQADRLEAFKKITEMIKQLPKVDLTVPLDSIEAPDLSSIQDVLSSSAPDFSETEEGKEAEKEVDDAGDELIGDSGYVHPSWTEACVTPPPGMAHLPYVPGDPALSVPRDPITGQPDYTRNRMEPPEPGVSSKRYYEAYERWRNSLPPPYWAPPAKGEPRGGE